MVAAVAFLGHRGAAELAAPDDERVVEQSALFQVLEQARDRLVGRAAVLAVVVLDLGVGVPFAAGAVVELDEAHAAFDEPAGHEAHAAKGLGLLAVHAVEFFRGLAFPREVHRAGGFRLHAEGEFVALDAGVEFAVVLAALEVGLVEPVEEGEFAGLARDGDLLGCVEVGDGRGALVEHDALVGRGHEASAPVAHAVDDVGFVVLHHDERGEVLVFRAQAIGDPASERGPAAEDGTGVHLQTPPAWLMPSETQERTTQRSSACSAVCGIQLENSRPLWPYCFHVRLRSEERRAGFAHRGDDGAEAVRQASGRRAC